MFLDKSKKKKEYWYVYFYIIDIFIIKLVLKIVFICFYKNGLYFCCWGWGMLVVGIRGWGSSLLELVWLKFVL